jgi:hypothetical protein
VPKWFLILNGIALLLMGIGLFSLRLRERPLHRAMFGLLWALICCVVGGALLLMAQGYIEQPGLQKTAPRRPHIPEFPTDR